MIAWIIYAVAAFAAAVVLTFVLAMFRPLPTRVDSSPGRTLVALYALTLAGPFGYSEVLTRTVGVEMKPAVLSAYEEAPIDGPMRYFRVLFYTGERASVLVIGSERTLWGGTDRPQLRLTLLRRGATWRVERSQMAYSEKLGKEEFVFPPYR